MGLREFFRGTKDEQRSQVPRLTLGHYRARRPLTESRATRPAFG